MGNCSIKSTPLESNSTPNTIRIMTDSGLVMEIKGPKLAQEVLNSFPGNEIYQKGQLSVPMFEHELLINGQFYYLLPFSVSTSKRLSETTPGNTPVSFRKYQDSAFEVLPSRKGVWKVKMAIDSKELEEMLSPENTEAFIQMMRSAARSSETSPGRSFRWRSMAMIAGGLRSPATSRRLTAC